MLAQLADDPEDRAVLAVLGDLLQRDGDPRGELIALQLGIKQVSAVVATSPLVRRRDELRAQLTPPIPDVLEQWFSPEGMHWGTGYLRALELSGPSNARAVEILHHRDTLAAALAAVWAHPSLRVLHSVSAYYEGAVALLAIHPPPTVRELGFARGAVDVSGVAAHVDAVGRLLAGVPGLRRLRITPSTELDQLAHPTVTTLVFDDWNELTPFHGLARHALPAVRCLELEAAYGSNLDLSAICAVLADAGWFAQVDELALRDRKPPPLRLAEILAHALPGRKLARLDLGHHAIPRVAHAKFAALCDELVGVTPEADVAPAATWAEHADKPEWGRGTIVRSFDGKVEIDFPHAGRKVFKADAAFLRFG